MKIKEVTRGIALSGSVAFATAGLTNCNHSGGVDPAPPPLHCGDIVQNPLEATAGLKGDTITFFIHPSPQVRAKLGVQLAWREPITATMVTGGTFVRSILSNLNTGEAQVQIRIDATDGGASDGGTQAAGSFTVFGNLTNYQTDCPVTQKFTFSSDGMNVTVAHRDSAIPLGAREPARIALVGQQGREVQLAAHTGYVGACGAEWSVSAGEMVTAEGGSLTWRLPETPGIYQAEVILDYGDEGFAIDTLQLEVG